MKGDGEEAASGAAGGGDGEEERVRVDVEELDPQKINMLLAHPVE